MDQQGWAFKIRNRGILSAIRSGDGLSSSAFVIIKGGGSTGEATQKQRRPHRNRDIKSAKSTTLSQMLCSQQRAPCASQRELELKRRAILKCKQWNYPAAKSEAQLGGACCLFREFAAVTGWMLLTSLLIPHSSATAHRYIDIALQLCYSNICLALW